MAKAIKLDDSDFKDTLSTENQNALKSLIVNIVPIPITIHFNFKQKWTTKEAVALEVADVQYDSFLCHVNHLEKKLIGTKIPDLLVVTASFSEKFHPIYGKEFILDKKGDRTFQYFVHERTTHINITHLSALYAQLIDYPTWGRLNIELIEKYCEATKLTRDQLIIQGADTYIVSGLAINFMTDSAPSYGKLLKQLVNGFSRMLSED
jgi:hypothetical protein